jgi:hypothetical protein
MVPGDVTRQTLPTIFAESLGGGGLLMAALADIDEADASRLADELTALGNRVISANLVSLGEVDGIRVALGEMKDYLTIGLESLARGEAPAAAAVLRANHAQAVFRTGFAEIARLRTSAERLIALEGFRPELLESPDVEFVTGLLRFKPLLWSEGAFRGFGSLAEVEDAFRRVDDLLELVEGLLGVLGPVDSTLRRAFNTALVRQALTGRFESEPLSTSELESFLEDGIAIPEPDLPEPLRSRTRGWLPMLRADLEPLAGGRIDPRFVDCVRMKL